MQSRKIDEYHIFLASPGDMDAERREVRRFFEEYNRYTAAKLNLQFTVVDWENYSSFGVGRPQELITAQTLEKFRDSLTLVIGLMGQRFGSPSGTHESGTEEEFEWALKAHLQTGFPEIKWFFRDLKTFQSSGEPQQIQDALDQWKKVLAFRARLDNGTPRLFYGTFTDTVNFLEVLRRDLYGWLNDEKRPWQLGRLREPELVKTADLPSGFYKKIAQDFESLDIAGIDNDRAVDIPLSEIYIRLRVIRDEDSAAEDEETDAGPIDIHAALGQYERLVIVGDPGSGKSTFLRFIALIIARARLESDETLAIAKLNLQPPLPIPFFISLWDLSDFIKRSGQAGGNTIADFIISVLAETNLSLSREALQEMLEAGSCCLLFDGLDEVPTEQGRSLISRLVEKFVARFDKNRFVVTSRVRGYTGDTILKGGFVRCDIQDFNESDRSEFLKNWFAALLGVSREDVLNDGIPSRIEYDALRSSIESKDRIRSLAVNPLLMTVIAIVHWNRKRLPDQRVDLYDECIDVLLGQRKSAERIGRYRQVEVLEERVEDSIQYDRAWTRKRFSEIALLILESGGDEITRSDVIGILQSRFRDRGAATDEQAAVEAETFLDRQELRSGLLVSRRSHSCRFVHLTFQEYLAAWNLATQTLDKIKAIIATHIRDPKWFETLQLLGGELAKSSDEKLDQYINFLLDNLETTIARQAPVIALCANILRDVKSVADIKAETQQKYTEALKHTLQAFQPTSRVPPIVQLEVLQALAPLGAYVKEHLIKATKSAYYQVRSEGLRMLVQHLPDDDLFSMGHIFDDRSQQTIYVYIMALFERDKNRAVKFLANQEEFNYKTAKALTLFLPWCRNYRRLGEILSANDIDSDQFLLILKKYLKAIIDTDLLGIYQDYSLRFFIDDEIVKVIESWVEDRDKSFRSRILFLLGMNYFPPRSLEMRLLRNLSDMNLYFIDPQETIDDKRLVRWSGIHYISKNELRIHFERMAQVLPIKLRF
jgi:energy-coupling factor transporter ATP-binding protein EcfA2